MSPLEPKSTDNVTIRLRVKRGNVKSATLQFTVDLDKISDGEAVWHDIPMKYEIADENMYFDYFICVIPKQSAPYKYHFKVENDVQTVYYNAFECYPEESGGEISIDASGDYYVMPDFATPDWAKGCVWYSIMPDTFYNSDTLNDKTTSSVYKADPWGTTHTAGDYSAGLSYFGGDLMGIYDKLDYIKSFGVTGLFMNPIWYAYHNAGYGAADMTQIDSTFGNDNLLKQLVKASHDKDMKVMLDGVFTYSRTSARGITNRDITPSKAVRKKAINIMTRISVTRMATWRLCGETREPISQTKSQENSYIRYRRR